MAEPDAEIDCCYWLGRSDGGKVHMVEALRDVNVSDDLDISAEEFIHSP